MNQFCYNTDEVILSMIKFVSERIARRREELDMTQEDLARKIIEPGQKLDSVRNFIARVELGKNEPGAYRLAKIAEGLGVDMNYFFDGVRQSRPVADNKPVVQEPSNKQEPLPSFEDVLKELRLNNSGRRAVVILEDRHIKSSREALEHLNITLEPGQRAFVVVLDNVDDQKKVVINSAIGLMQGVKSVVDVPLNGEG